MMSSPQPRSAPSPHFSPLVPSNETPEGYLMLPLALLRDVRDSPLAIGLYALSARLFLVHHAAIPLSAADVQRFDPALSHGAVTRAFERLCSAGWLEAASQPGHKNSYRPTWGRISGEPRLWQLGRPRLDCPRHINTLRLDRRLLDVFMGRLDPHPIHAADVQRYTSAPLLSLRDVGSYALCQSGRPCSTPTLVAWGLVREGRAVALPPTQEILARASQLTFQENDGVLVSREGYARLGLNVAPSLLPAPDTPGQTLIYVPPELIGSLIGGVDGRVAGPSIGGLIGSQDAVDPASSASQSAETASEPVIRSSAGNAGIPKEIKRTSESILPPQPPPAVCTAPPETGGGKRETTFSFLRSEGMSPTVARTFEHLNLAAACADFHKLSAEGCRIGAIVQHWRAELPTADKFDEQAVALAPPAFTPTLVATLASYLREGMDADNALDMSTWWAENVTRASQERQLAQEEPRYPGLPHHFAHLKWRDDAPRRTPHAPPTKLLEEAHAWALSIAPPDFTQAMVDYMANEYLYGVRDTQSTVNSARIWQRQNLAAQARQAARTMKDEG